MVRKKCSYLVKILILLVLVTFGAIPNLRGMAEGADYPAKAIKLMIPFRPGGATDTSARAIASAMEKHLGVPVVCENRTGGGGSVGWQWLSRQKPDGYTMGIIVTSTIVQQYTGVSGVDIKSFEPISMIAYADNAIATLRENPFRNLKDLVNFARRNPGNVKVSNNGSGSIWHLCAAGLEQAAGVEFTHVPFQGGKPAVVAMIGGHVDVSSSAIGDVAEFVKAEKARILGIPSAERFPMFPEVPTFGEQGYDVIMGGLIGLATPKGIPKEVIRTLENACAKGVQSEEYDKIQKNFGNRIWYMNSADFARFIMDQDALYQKIIKQLGLEKTK